MATVTRKPNEFCWINMLTSRPEEARAFFASLLGWTYFEMPGIGHGIRVEGHDIGGLFDLNGPNTPAGLPPYIGVMVKVEDADSASEQVVALGGTAKPAFDVMEQGRMAVCHDPNGGEFDVWEPRKMHGTDVDPSLHGAPSWFEVITTDVARATEFYSALFGWTPQVMPMPGYDYTAFFNGGDPVAGLMPISPEMAGLKPHWATYFTVNDPDEVAAEAVKLGAELHVPVRDIPKIGRFCGITSPQGVMFHAIRYLPRQGT